MRWPIILFDLDGTLTDPREGLLNGIEHALASIGMSVDDRDALDVLIGPPAQDGFASYLGLTEPSLTQAVLAYRQYVVEKGAFENRVIDGIPELLDALQRTTATLLVATSKPTATAELVLDHFALRDAFAVVAGAEPDGSRRHKRDIIQYALDQLPGAEPGDAVMIGDREHDVIGARALGVASIGVLWGYGGSDELEAARADHVVGTVAELEQVLLTPP